MVFFCVDMRPLTLDTFKITHATNLASQYTRFTISHSILSLTDFPLYKYPPPKNPFLRSDSMFCDSFLKLDITLAHLFTTTHCDNGATDGTMGDDDSDDNDNDDDDGRRRGWRRRRLDSTGDGSFGDGRRRRRQW